MQPKFLALAATVVIGAAVATYLMLGDQGISSDPESLAAIGWGKDQSELKQIYSGAGTSVASLGYRNLEKMNGCAGTDDAAAKRRRVRFNKPDTGVELCEVSIDRLKAAKRDNDADCLTAIESSVNGWQRDWHPNNAESAYVFHDVYPADTADGVIDIYDQVHTIEHLAGWPIGDAVAGFENSPTVWNQDYLGWSPKEIRDSCPVSWIQCFDRKTPVYKGVADLEALGSNEGLCIVELSPEFRLGMGLYGAIDIIRETAPDTEVVVASFTKNREDLMSRAADWLIDNQARFNIVAARTSNVIYLETALLKPGIQELCGEDEWCQRVSYAPYQTPCTGDPYAGGLAYAHKSQVQAPDEYIPMARQYERMIEAGIIAVKGAGHEGWKNALAYPDCSPALLSVGVTYVGTLPQHSRNTPLVEGGWAAQGWRWHPDYYCEEKSIRPDQVACATNNAPSMGYRLPSGEIASPLMAAFPKERNGDNLGNAWVTPYVVGAVALLKSDNLLPDLSAAEVIGLIHETADTVTDDRRCDQDPANAEPDGWLRIGLEFFDMELASLETAPSERQAQLLDYPWVYTCTDPDSPDTAPFHTDNTPDYSNQRLNIGRAVKTAQDRL